MSNFNGMTHASITTVIRRFPDFEVSWAGASPRKDEFCFASEDGRLLMMQFDGSNPLVLGEPIITSGESINGLATTKDLMAVSTRSEVTIITLGYSRVWQGFKTLIPYGSHGVISSPSGRFISPCGHKGLMTVMPVHNRPFQPIGFRKVINQSFNFYKAAYLPTPAREIVACATRFGGLVGLDLSPGAGTRKLYSQSQEGLDIVDVCALPSTAMSPAAAAVSKDCTIILSANVLEPSRTTAIKFLGIEGIAYRLLSTRGHLYLLTSKALYAMKGLASRFLLGEDVEYTANSWQRYSMDAIDINLVNDRFLLVVLVDGVRQIDVDQFPSVEKDLSVDEQSESSIFPKARWSFTESSSEEINASLELV